MYHLIIIVMLALATVTSTHAQAPSEQPGSIPTSDECLLNTSDEVWTAVGLSAEQLEQVKSIQTMCQTDCTALQERGGSDPTLADAMLNIHRDNVREVLTEEQYNKWITWCDHRPAKG